MSVIKMTAQEWIKTKVNPLQRDTERHASKAKHLLNPLPVHSIVWAAKLPSGTYIKLDGHTRAYMWEHNIVPSPKSIEVHVMEVKDLDEAANLYKTFDSKDALETTADKISGALRGMNYKPQSGLIASGAYSTALRVCWAAVYGYSHDMRPRDVYENINEFAAELIALDEMNLRKGQFSTAAMSAFMLSYRKHGDSILPFWKGVIAGSGTKARGRMDGIQAAIEITLASRGGRTTSGKGSYGGSAVADTTNRLLACVEKWNANEDLASIPRPLELTSYLDNAHKHSPKYKLIKKTKRPVVNGGVTTVEATVN